LGHKSIRSTLVYTHLLSDDDLDSFHVKVASTLEEFQELLEKGYEFISDFEGVIICRKRKKFAFPTNDKHHTTHPHTQKNISYKDTGELSSLIITVTFLPNYFQKAYLPIMCYF
jgi:hypothetical protein